MLFRLPRPPYIFAELPPGTHVTNIASHGASFWTRTARLEAEHSGSEQEYFLKVILPYNFQVIFKLNVYRRRTVIGERG